MRAAPDSCPPSIFYPYYVDLNLSDKEILANSRENPRMFGIIVDRYQDAFLRKATGILHSRDLAEDAVQETFLKIYKYAASFKEQKGATAKSWMYRILVNTCCTLYVQKKKERGHVELVDFSETDFASPEEETPEESNRPHIDAMLAKMPDNLSRMLRLYFLEEKSQKEIAKAEGMTLEAVRTRIHRAKKFFRDISIKTL
jgi:RNA polymerase sigma factor (sigma-70 family)